MEHHLDCVIFPFGLFGLDKACVRGTSGRFVVCKRNFRRTSVWDFLGESRSRRMLIYCVCTAVKWVWALSSISQIFSICVRPARFLLISFLSSSDGRGCYCLSSCFYCLDCFGFVSSLYVSLFSSCVLLFVLHISFNCCSRCFHLFSYVFVRFLRPCCLFVVFFRRQFLSSVQVGFVRPFLLHYLSLFVGVRAFGWLVVLFVWCCLVGWCVCVCVCVLSVAWVYLSVCLSVCLVVVCLLVCLVGWLAGWPRN